MQSRRGRPVGAAPGVSPGIRSSNLRIHTWSSAIAAAGVVAVSLWIATPAAGQGKGGGKGADTPPRGPDGHADLQGIWRAASDANSSVEPRTAAYGLMASRGAIVDPPDGKIPYRPEA